MPQERRSPTTSTGAPRLAPIAAARPERGDHAAARQRLLTEIWSARGPRWVARNEPAVMVEVEWRAWRAAA